ncbi:hypothetical protein X797_008658 [Metarhizium robertsii]|uniref:Metallopeptidase, catalytic domain protein n=1 Tax=Metarhizium robertsii TaxID=568076 RepID=A0A014N0A4_9HYPO|nr:hypothetical protein X797_008658 [Metarhizium robertsii]
MWLLTSALLSLLCLLAVSEACYLGKHNAYNIGHNTDADNANGILWRRVRDPGSDGGESSVSTISNLFTVGDSNLKGGCASKLGVMDEWLKEAIQLHEAAKTAFANYKTNKALAVLVNQYFGVKFDVATDKDKQPTFSITDRKSRKMWNEVGDRISRVSQFLSGAGLVNPQKPGEAPRVFCSGDAAEYVDWGDVMKDKYGKDVVLERDENTREPTRYLTVREARPEMAASGKGSAFWLSAFNGYTYPWTLPSPYEKQICGPVKTITRYALTAGRFLPIFISEDVEWGDTNRHILFCPNAFNPGSPKEGDPHSYPSLAQAVSASNYPTGSKSANDVALDRILPVSATFYHELYHLTDDGETRDPFCFLANGFRDTADQLESVLDAAQKQNEMLTINPETYVFFATAAYMNLNAPEGLDPVVYVGGVPMKVSGLPF